MTGCSWAPRAFEGVPLRRHNAAVAAAAAVLLGERIGRSRLIAYPLEKATGLDGARLLLAASVLAGGLHDAGKASPYYRDRGSFYGHEMVGAALAYSAASRLGKEGYGPLALAMHIASWAIARHHSAMRERHPKYLAESAPDVRGDAERVEDLVRAASEALKALKREPGCLEEALPRPLQRPPLGDAIMEALEGVGAEPGDVRRYAKELSSYLGRAGVVYEIPAHAWLASVWIASGALIVADILVARFEGRSSDDGSSSVYVESWMRELGVTPESLRSMAASEDDVDKIIVEALEPLLRA